MRPETCCGSSFCCFFGRRLFLGYVRELVAVRGLELFNSQTTLFSSCLVLTRTDASPLGTLDFEPLTLLKRQEPPQTRHFTFELTRKRLNPDGVTRDFLVVNGEYPGPTIEANLGDTISVAVINNIDDPKEGTSIHWHGLPQRDTKWADGVPSVTQCPIAAGSNFTYTFKPEVAGTTWWHAHFTAQYTDGLFGALIIHGSQYAEDYDIDIGPIHLVST